MVRAADLHQELIGFPIGVPIHGTPPGRFLARPSSSRPSQAIALFTDSRVLLPSQGLMSGRIRHFVGLLAPSS